MYGAAVPLSQFWTEPTALPLAAQHLFFKAKSSEICTSLTLSFCIKYNMCWAMFFTSQDKLNNNNLSLPL